MMLVPNLKWGRATLDLIDSIQLNFAKVYIWHLESKLKCICIQAWSDCGSYKCRHTRVCSGDLPVLWRIDNDFSKWWTKPRITSSDKLVYIFLDDILYIKIRASFIVFVYKTGYTQVFLLLPWRFDGILETCSGQFVVMSCFVHYKRSWSLLPAS